MINYIWHLDTFEELCRKAMICKDKVKQFSCICLLFKDHFECFSDNPLAHLTTGDSWQPHWTDGKLEHLNLLETDGKRRLQTALCRLLGLWESWFLRLVFSLLWWIDLLKLHKEGSVLAQSVKGSTVVGRHGGRSMRQAGHTVPRVRKHVGV